MDEKNQKPWSWSIGSVCLKVKCGNLLEAPEEAWVNSEQTDFVLASGDHSVSAQINRVWPRARTELYEQTKGLVFPAGTVIPTTGPEGRIIYHAGFHEPQDWLFGEEDREATFLDYILECIEKILEDAVQRKLSSVAFPLIGTGVFGLKRALFANLFFSAVGNFARRTTNSLAVVLYVWKEEEVEEIVRTGTQSLTSMIADGGPLLQEAGGHSLLRELRPLVRRQTSNLLQERSLVHFSEVALATDLAVTAEVFGSSVYDLLLPCAPHAAGVRLSFGLVRDRIGHIGGWPVHNLPDWLATRLRYLKESSSRHAIGRLVSDRNDWAHHRTLRPVSDIVNDVESLFGPKSMPNPWPKTNHSLWLRHFPEGYGLLDSINWAGSEISWVLPRTRHRFIEKLKTEDS